MNAIKAGDINPRHYDLIADTIFYTGNPAGMTPQGSAKRGKDSIELAGTNIGGTVLANGAISNKSSNVSNTMTSNLVGYAPLVGHRATINNPSERELTELREKIERKKKRYENKFHPNKPLLDRMAEMRKKTMEEIDFIKNMPSASFETVPIKIYENPVENKTIEESTDTDVDTEIPPNLIHRNTMEKPEILMEDIKNTVPRADKQFTFRLTSTYATFLKNMKPVTIKILPEIKSVLKIEQVKPAAKKFTIMPSKSYIKEEKTERTASTNISVENISLTFMDPEADFSYKDLLELLKE